MITVDDDTPVATAGTSTGTVDEDGVVEGIADAGPGDGIAGGTGDVAGRHGCDRVGDGAVPVWRGRAADYGFTANVARRCRRWVCRRAALRR